MNLLLRTRQSRCRLGFLLQADMEKFAYYEDRLQRQITFSKLFGSVFDSQSEVFLKMALTLSEERFNKTSNAATQAVEQLVAKEVITSE